MLTVKQNTLVIADGSIAGGSVVGDITVNGMGWADVVPPIGAAGPKVFDRTTQELKVVMTILRQHGSAEAAEQHRFMARQRTSNTGALIIERETGTAIHRYVSAEAHWEDTNAPQYDGECSIITYNIKCAPFVYSTDVPGETLADVIRDPLLINTNRYGPSPGILWFPAPWSGGVHSRAAATSVTLADMAA